MKVMLNYQKNGFDISDGLWNDIPVNAGGDIGFSIDGYNQDGSKPGQFTGVLILLGCTVGNTYQIQLGQSSGVASPHYYDPTNELSFTAESPTHTIFLPVVCSNLTSIGARIKSDVAGGGDTSLVIIMTYYGIFSDTESRIEVSGQVAKRILG